MTRDQLIDRINETLGERLLGVEQISPRRVFIDINAEHVIAVTRVMFEELGARFQIASGIDTGEVFEVLYHWAFDRLDCIVTVRTEVARATPVLDSIARVCPAAEWIEREMWELLGIDFRDHPDLRHLLLADDWPAGKYPLRRDYER